MKPALSQQEGIDIVERLLALLGANLNATVSVEKLLLLAVAVLRDNGPVTKVLIENGANIDVQFPGGASLLEVAAGLGNFSAADIRKQAVDKRTW